MYTTLMGDIMTKTVSLPDVIYADLVSVSGDLTSLARKPFSLGMTIACLTSIYNVIKTFPGFQEGLKKKFDQVGILSPEEFDRVWDELSKEILRK